MKYLRIMAIIAAMLVTLCLLLGGQRLYEKYVVKDGLQQAIDKVAPADEIRVDKDAKPPTVYIRLSQVNDLQSDYEGLTDVIHAQLGPDYRVVLLDDRTPELQSLYEQCSFPIQEAIATGHFQSMKTGVEQLAAAGSANCSISVDSDNVYLELSDQKERGCLYEVVPRLSQQEMARSSSAGGEGS